jgi:undecaprenyl-diphosphatase
MSALPKPRPAPADDRAADDRAADYPTADDRAADQRAVDHRAAMPPGDRAADHSRAGKGSVAWLLIAILSLVAFVFLTVAVASTVVNPFDQYWLAQARTLDSFPVIWNTISQSANIPLILVGVGMVVWLVWKKQRREALLVLLIFAAVTGTSEGVKQLLGRVRPSGTGDGIPGVPYSYPSGHELEALTIYGIAALRTWRSSHPLALRLVVVILVAIEIPLVGVARLALNTHYPTDVFAGVLIGIAALGLYAWLTRPGAWAVQPAGAPDEAPDEVRDAATGS